MNATCSRGDDAPHAAPVEHDGRADLARCNHRTSTNIDDDELRLLLADGVGPILHARLIAAFGSAGAIVRAGGERLAEVEGIGPVRAECIRRSIGLADPDGERRELNRLGARIVRLRDDEYPALLATIADPPPALWVRGSFEEPDRCCVAVVGSRRCTSYGREQASKLAFGLAESCFTIVSGGARGIDAAAHRAALRAGGRTIAVLGCGLGHCYPPEHGDLYNAIAAAGAVVSESPISAPPRPEFFPRRNRIISGLSLGVVVVEAAVRSGALITAREAAESHHREVMAIPGPVDSPVSAGCHRAIREGWAGLVTGIDDVLAQLESTLLLVQAALKGRAGGATDIGRRASSAVQAETVDRTIAGVGASAAPHGPAGVQRPCHAATDSANAPMVRLVEAMRIHGPSSAARLSEVVDAPIGSVFAALTILQLRRAVTRRAGVFVLGGPPAGVIPR